MWVPIGSPPQRTGFQKQAVTGIEVKVAALPRVDLTLTPGLITETIEVVGILPLVETSRNNQGGTIEAPAGFRIARQRPRFHENTAPHSRRHLRSVIGV